MAQPLRTVTLYKTEGSSDKVYGLSITIANDLFLVNYMNGRRGETMRTGLKTANPVTMEVATKEFEKVLKAKLKDGYTEAVSGQVYTNSEDAGRVSGYRPMLPADLPKSNPEAMLKTMLSDVDWGLQEKKDGENRTLKIQVGSVLGINKNGLFVDIPAQWQDNFGKLGNFVSCGEQIGETFYAFDLIEHNGINLCDRTFMDRYSMLSKLVTEGVPGFELVPTVFGRNNKMEHMRKIDADKGEGVVFKRLDAVFEQGKNSNSFRHKFWESMTCVVLATNVQRSVAVGAKDSATGEMISLGNVSIPTNQPIPSVGSSIEVRFLYRYEEGCLFQPTYLGPRTDVHYDTITTDQITRIKRKGMPTNLDDETLSEQARTELAKAEFTDNLDTLVHFMSQSQIEEVKHLALGENGQFFMDKIQELASHVHQMPQTSDTGGQGEQALIQLRYCLGGAEWLITERDKSAPSSAGKQLQATGSADIGNGHEIGYVSIQEILEKGGELDFDFEPMPLQEYLCRQDADTETTPACAA